MTEVKTYTGGCHCGKVRYEVTTGFDRVISCNCSICAKTGAILTFVGEGLFKLLSGEDQLTDYMFNKKKVHHLFCKDCGVRSFAKGKMPDGRDMFAVNVRCLDDVDIASLTVTPIDGKSF